MDSVRNGQLRRVADEIKRTRADAAQHRQRLVLLTGFATEDALAGLCGAERELELMTAFTELLACARRAAELIEERKRIVVL